jgi:hypothetical protein
MPLQDECTKCLERALRCKVGKEPATGQENLPTLQGALLGSAATKNIEQAMIKDEVDQRSRDIQGWTSLVEYSIFTASGLL